MLIYTNGCSHSDDHPTLKESYVWPNQLMSGFTKSFNYYHNQSVLPLTLSEIKALDKDFLVNDARSSVGNDKIFHQSMESICKLMSTGKKPDFVIIQWSGPNRREHCLLDEKPLFVTLYDNTEYHLKYEPMGSMHTIHYVYCLQQFLINHDIPYYFFNYMQFDYSITELEIYKKVNINRFVDFGLHSRTLFTGLIDLFKEKRFTRDEQGHANEEGNKFIADKIMEKIKNDPLNEEFIQKYFVKSI
jgi:hypothetical protein